MTTKHTQGPWRVKIPTDGSTHYPHIVDVKYEHVLCRLTDLYCLPDRLEANAQLIAAAPDLLEALENLVYKASNILTEEQLAAIFTNYDGISLRNSLTSCDEAIAKARGGEL